MIVDASAFMAMLRLEPEREAFRELLLNSTSSKLSAGTLVEVRMVAEGYGVRDELEALISEFSIQIVPLDEAQADAAALAFRLYGKGRHPAKLNLGDLFAYALAKVTGEPLLFKGNDFAQTDLTRA